MLTQFIKTLCIISISKVIFGNLSNISPRDVPYLNHTDMKIILVWTFTLYFPPPFNDPSTDLQNDPFREQSCHYQNCYYTSDQSLLDSYADFHAIMFYGVATDLSMFPKKRNPFQYYVDVMDEPAVLYNMDRWYFNNFFNLTATYKLDSDIPWPYFKVLDKTENYAIVGPRIDMQWKVSPNNHSDEFLSKLYGKTQLAAWFVSNCKPTNNRGLFGYNLMEEIIIKSNLTIDVFGRCSYFKCPSADLPTYEDCNQMLSDGYLFYLAFENSDVQDYVTEKVLRALQNDVVPVVYGGADYSRFLPPGSYIDAKKLGIKKTALIMIYLYTDRDSYSRFFSWKNTYEYRDNVLGFSCGLSAILNSDNSEPHTYPRFTDWWNDRIVNNTDDPLT